MFKRKIQSSNYLIVRVNNSFSYLRRALKRMPKRHCVCITCREMNYLFSETDQLEH